MKSFDPEQRIYQRIAQTYADVMRVAMGLVTWTLLALMGMAAAFVIGRLVWSLLMLALRLIARI